MKKGSPFTLQKVSRYSKAKYASESPKSLIRHALWLAWNFPNKMIKGAVTALLIAGLAAGLQACEDDTIVDGDVDFEKDAVVNIDGYDNDGDCIYGEKYCTDIETAALCGEDGNFYTKDCNEFCIEYTGAWYQSGECFEGKCECRDYPVDGGLPFECYPNEVYCEEDNMLRTCHDETWTWESCEDICKAQDNKMISKGCDVSNLNDPCMCEEDCISCGDQDDDLDYTEQDKTEADSDLDTSEQDKIEIDGDLDARELDKTEADADLDTTEQEIEISESDLD